MDNFSDIVGKRAAPGVLVFDFDDRLLYCNTVALDMLPELRSPEAAAGENIGVLSEICLLCSQLKNNSGSAEPQQAGPGNAIVLRRGEGLLCTLRAFLIGGSGEGDTSTHIMVLVEGIIEKHKVDFEKARKDFTLSARETEVLQLVCKGLANKEIAERLFISEYTVKDHIKKIMNKMKATTRSEIISLLK